MNKKNASDKYLVVEQKGWRVLILGLAIASIFSLTFRAVFSPRRIQYEIERASGGADSRISSTLEGAYLSLSNGFWPRLAIVIKKFQVQANDPCLFGARATIEDLVLPVALSTLMDRTLVFKRIEVGKLNIEMKARREGCGEMMPNLAPLPPTLSATTPEPSPRTSSLPAPLNKLSLERPPLVQTMSVESSLLRHVILHQVDLQFSEWPHFQWHLKGVDVRLPLMGENKTHIEGLITLTSGNPSFSFQGVHARLEVDSDSDQVSAKVKGAWREGRIEVDGRWSPRHPDFQWQGQFTQIPWSQLIVLAKALGQTAPLPSSSQAWVSANVLWQHETDKPEHVEVVDGHIEGEFGDFVLGKVIATKDETGPAASLPEEDTALPEAPLRRWNVQPYKVLVKDVDLDVLTKMLGWNEPPPTLDRLGEFEGEALFTENQLVSLAGEWRDLKIIFSNRGLRELQGIKKMSLALTGASNRWNGFLKSIELVDGNWKGDISLVLDQNEKRVSLTTEFSDFKLNPEVEQLMTINGSLTPMAGKLVLNFHDQEPVNIGGFLKLDKGVISDVTVDRPRFDFQGSSDLLEGKVQFQAIHWPREQQVHWPPIAPEGLDSLQLRNVSGSFSRTPKTMVLSDFQGLLPDLKARFQIQGGWNEFGRVSGGLQVRGDRKNQNFNLSGTRQAPLWQEIIK